MALPASMTAVEISGPGGPEVLRAATRPLPNPAGGQVLLRVEAAGVNPHDCYQRKRGTPPAGATDVPGLEVAGTIVAMGDAVAPTPALPGELVCALVNGGGYAQYCVAEAPLVFSVASGMSAVEAAGIPEAVFTAWFNLEHLCRLAPGEWLLVHGGTGGVASMAIGIAKLIGANVIATSRTAEKQALCRELGADATINYSSENVADAAIAATKGRGVDVVLDAVGARYAEENLRALAVGGRVAYISGGSGGAFNLSLPALMAKRAFIIGSMLRPVPLQLKAELAKAIRERVWPAIGKAIVPRIDSTFPLARADDAHRRIESGAHIGKVVLNVAA